MLTRQNHPSWPIGLVLSTLLVSAAGCPAGENEAGESESETKGDGDGDPAGDGDGDPSGDGDGDPSGDGDGDPTGDGDGDGDPTGDGDGDPTGDGDGDPTGDGDGDDGFTPDPEGCAPALDILVVLDNSGSMGEAQANFVVALPALINPLDAAGVSWRLGVTTSDNGNPWCPQGQTTPERGRLVMSSCKTRLGDFLFNNGQIDARDQACNDLCTLDGVQLLPTTTEVDPNPAVRPWIENIGGENNVVGSSPLDALTCVVPMGINGCGFESQLESSYLSVVRAETEQEDDPQDAQFGFLRAEASLLVLIVSDEADCSSDPLAVEIFSQDGNKVFWSDPDDSFPSSAVCWNAGVECIGDPSDYDSCNASNKDVNGNAGVGDEDAVLHPLSRYLSLLDDLEQAKQQLDPEATVRVSLVSGTAVNGNTVYQDTLDPQYQGAFGIGPGCEQGPISAVPPVRMRDVSGLSGGQRRSICAPDTGAQLAQIVQPFVSECE